MFLQLVRTVTMGKTVLVFAPQTARYVNLLMAHAVVLLVGWVQTVVLVKLVDINQHLK